MTNPDLLKSDNIDSRPWTTLISLVARAASTGHLAGPLAMVHVMHADGPFCGLRSKMQLRDPSCSVSKSITYMCCADFNPRLSTPDALSQP